jgi:hypothetical protein
MSNKVVRVILTFVNPHARDLNNIKTLIRESLTLSESRLYVSGPENKLHHYSTESKESVKALIKLKHDTLKSDPKSILDLNVYD